MDIKQKIFRADARALENLQRIKIALLAAGESGTDQNAIRVALEEMRRQVDAQNESEQES